MLLCHSPVSGPMRNLLLSGPAFEFQNQKQNQKRCIGPQGTSVCDRVAVNWVEMNGTAANVAFDPTAAVEP